MQMFKSIKDQTDEVLLVKLKRGNIRSFEAIYDRYAPMVLNFVRKMIKDQMRAEDITQNIFMRLYVSRNSLEPGLSLKNWLFVCARNEATSVCTRALTIAFHRGSSRMVQCLTSIRRTATIRMAISSMLTSSTIILLPMLTISLPLSEETSTTIAVVHW